MRKLKDLKKLREYTNGNYRIVLLEDGTKIKHTEDEEFRAEFPDNMDLKLTNWCDKGCHMCFIAGTKILMADFSYKNIEEVKVGEEVLGFDEFIIGGGRKRKIKKTKVEKTFCHVEEELLELKSDNGVTVVCTPNHPIYTGGHGANHSRFFRPASNVKIGDVLYTVPFNQNIDVDYTSREYRLGYFLGAFTGDGHVGHSIDNKGYDMFTTRFVTLNEEVNNYVYEIAKELHPDFYQLDFKMLDTKTGSKDLVKTSVRSGKREIYYFMKKLYKSNLGITVGADYCAGFLAGFFDTEGHIDRKSKVIRLTNTNLQYIEEVERCLDYFNFTYTREYTKKSNTRNKDIYNVRIISGQEKVWAKFLWITRPIYDYKSLETNYGEKMFYIQTNLKSKKEIKDKQYVYNLQTEAGTYIANNLLVHNCHENSTINGNHCSIENLEFINSLTQGTELALGGGLVSSHPQFEEILNMIKQQGVIANATFHETEFMDRLEDIKRWQKEGLLYGIGVSVHGYNEEIIKAIQSVPNTVIHLIAGLTTMEQFKKLSGLNLKILILGYKQFRRGADLYLSSASREINKNLEELTEKLMDVAKGFKVVSFDNLALEQLKVKAQVPPTVWESCYQGEEGSANMYIDAVEGKFARNSTSIERYDIKTNVKDMFNIIRTC